MALLGKPLLSREGQRFCDFLDRVPPVEPGLGLDAGLSRRFAESGVLKIVEVNMQVSVKSARGQIACSDPRSGLVLWLLSRTVTERGLGSLMPSCAGFGWMSEV